MKSKIRSSYVTLVRAIDANEILDYLFQKMIISGAERDSIRRMSDRDDGMRQVLNIVLRSCHPECCVEFVNSLREHYSFLADDLSGGEIGLLNFQWQIRMLSFSIAVFKVKYLYKLVLIVVKKLEIYFRVNHLLFYFFVVNIRRLYYT